MSGNGEMIEKAIIIEPEPDNFRYLQINILLNKLTDRTICLNSGVSDHTGICDFELSKDNYGDHRVKMNFDNLELTELFSEQSRKNDWPVLSEVWPYGIKRSGMSFDEYFSLKKNWNYFWIVDQSNHTFHPKSIKDFPEFFSRLSVTSGDFTDVIFSKRLI